MIDENKPQYVWRNHRMEFKSKDDEKLYKELKEKKQKISLYDFVKNGYKITIDEDLKGE